MLGSLPPLPIRHCYVVCAPLAAPGRLVTPNGGGLLSFGILRHSRPITQLLSAAATDLGLSPGRLRFVSDALESSDGPSLLFFTDFLPDPVLGRLTSGFPLFSSAPGHQ
ncbi:hypothetical protein AB1Y20_005624 [Prymnesium parvum]|uniref:Uncharacterized protein n=1 Tax=Prymnesium parvum TaxID=97485 RepID=A0AB34J6J8_PRYPA